MKLELLSSKPPPPPPPPSYVIFTASSESNIGELQDLVDVLPDVLKAAGSEPLKFDLSITLGDRKVSATVQTKESVNKYLVQVKEELQWKGQRVYDTGR